MLTAGKGPDTTLFPEGSNRTINVETSYGGITRDANGKITGKKAIAMTYLVCCCCRSDTAAACAVYACAATGAKAIAMTYLLDEKPSYSEARYAAEAWEDQLNLLIGPSPNGALWSYPDLSEGSVSRCTKALTHAFFFGFGKRCRF